MRKLFIVLVITLLTSGLFLSQQADAQSPQKMSYQAVVRNSSQELVTNQSIGMQISILQNSESGSAVYVETQTPTTNANGLASLEIGAGTVQSGDFAAINWADGSYFIKTETDPAGGTSYTITGTSQLLSIPFALHANEVDPSVPQGTQAGEMQYWNGTEWLLIAAGNEGDVLIFVDNIPTWVGESNVGTVENPITGKTWMDRNLGASQIATSSTDADAYGDLYQWGRATDGHEKRTSGITATQSNSDTPGHGNYIITSSEPYDWRSPQNDDLWQGVNGINNPCPNGYRLPTGAEWEAEQQSWSSFDAAGAFASTLKLPVGGSRDFFDGSLYLVGSYGGYWSSTVDDIYIRTMNFNDIGAAMASNGRAIGSAVRCIKE